MADDCFLAVKDMVKNAFWSVNFYQSTVSCDLGKYTLCQRPSCIPLVLMHTKNISTWQDRHMTGQFESKSRRATFR